MPQTTINLSLRNCLRRERNTEYVVELVGYRIKPLHPSSDGESPSNVIESARCIATIRQLAPFTKTARRGQSRATVQTEVGSRPECSTAYVSMVQLHVQLDPKFERLHVAQ